MVNYISNHPNNPINCNEEQVQCNYCQSEIERSMEGFEYCVNCNVCEHCGDYKVKDVNCKQCTNDNI